MTLAELQQEYTQKALQLGVLTYEISALEAQIDKNYKSAEKVKREMEKLSQQAAEQQKKQESQAAQEVKND
jgi:predicted ATP-grasp superfamily ATP-dependent carboligase